MIHGRMNAHLYALSTQYVWMTVSCVPLFGRINVTSKLASPDVSILYFGAGRPGRTLEGNIKTGCK